jgi:hypothetical protein
LHKNGPFEEAPTSKPLMDKALLGGGEVRKLQAKFPNKINILGVL